MVNQRLGVEETFFKSLDLRSYKIKSRNDQNNKLPKDDTEKHLLCIAIVASAAQFKMMNLEENA